MLDKFYLSPGHILFVSACVCERIQNTLAHASNSFVVVRGHVRIRTHTHGYVRKTLRFGSPLRRE